ncbi:acyltransferase [Endozoicomonas sp. (ex Bugula neritina AB1)]|nr:acyltransferase [Endozoicomonas sp. (ex Bugula neritina AB1)]
MTGNFYSHSAIKVTLGKLIHWLCGGWVIEGEPPKDINKYIIIVAHHTSNWDFVVGAAAKLIMRLRARFFAKKSLFKFPLGFLMRGLGGVPIERSKAGNHVQQMVNAINDSEHFVLVITPEGTRSKVERWKTGFYHIACGANIPVVPVGFDFTHKKIVFGKAMDMTGDIVTDFQAMHEFFVPYKGKNPEWSCNEPAENPNIYQK